MGGRSINEITEIVIGAAIKVHRALGPGLLESAYEQCLCHELRKSGLDFERNRPLQVVYDGIELDCAYRLNVIVEGSVLVVVKVVDRTLPVHKAQTITYLKLTGLTIGLLINFGDVTIKDGLHRIANRYREGE